MFKFLKDLFRGMIRPASTINKANTLSVNRELQELRLTLQEREALIERLKARAAGADSQQAAEQAGLQAHFLESFFSDAAAPISQLLLQEHLSLKAGKALPPEEIFKMFRKLLEVFHQRGLQIEGVSGQAIAFDAARHQPLDGRDNFSSGDSVRVRIPGILYQDKIIRRAMVDREGS